MYVGTAAEALPLLTGAAYRRRLSAPRKWVVGWCAVLLAGNVIALVLSLQDVNNHWVNYVGTPIADGIALWALSLMQISPVAALSLRMMNPLLGITWTLMVLLVENVDTFSLLAEPFAGLLLLGGAIYTLVSRAFHESSALSQYDWLWFAAGLALYSGSAVALPPTAHMLLTKWPHLVVRAYEVKALFEIIAFLAIARGMTCPKPAWGSGGSSSRASSRSRSSSPASSWRS